MPQDEFTARFAIESNRWADAASLKQAMLFRGIIVSAWAQVDTIVSETLLRCNRMYEYGHLIPMKYPGDAKARRRSLQKVCRAPGPMRRGRRAVLFAMREYRKAHSIRHLIAHGGMRIIAPGQVQFSDWPKGQGDAYLRVQVVPLRALEAEAERWAGFARRVGDLFVVGAQRLELPTLDQCEE